MQHLFDDECVSIKAAQAGGGICEYRCRSGESNLLSKYEVEVVILVHRSGRRARVGFSGYWLEGGLFEYVGLFDLDSKGRPVSGALRSMDNASHGGLIQVDEMYRRIDEVRAHHENFLAERAASRAALPTAPEHFDSADLAEPTNSSNLSNFSKLSEFVKRRVGCFHKIRYY
jgi:hypothetical protein